MASLVDAPPPMLPVRLPARDDGRDLRGLAEARTQAPPHRMPADISPHHHTHRTPNKRPFTLPYLPTEILQEILFHLSPHDFDSARLACRDWFQAASCRALLQHNINALHAYPGASRSNQWSTLQTFSVPQLRRYFTTLVTEWPGSRHRVPCLKTRLDARALLDFANVNAAGTQPSTSAQPGGTTDSFECVGFSRQTGSFAAMVVGRRANRKLYICRIFSKTHLTLESRPHRYSCCPCVPEPGPLYMVFDIKTGLNLRIVKVEMEELENPSSVKELSITFETGIVETYTFQGLAPHRIYQLNIRDKAVRTAAAAHTHNCNNIHCRQQSLATSTRHHHGHSGSTQHGGGKKLLGMLHGILHVFGPRGSLTHGPAVLEVKTAMQPTVPRTMRVRLFGVEEPCHVICVPFDGHGRNMGLLAISRRTGTVYVCGTSSASMTPAPQPHFGRKGNRNEEATALTAHMHHWLRVPGRSADTGEVAFVSVAPLMHYDIGQRIAYMGVLVGYSSGEIWLWRMSRAWRHLATGSPADEMEELPAGKYRPEQTPCISTAIPPPLETAPTGKEAAAVPVLNVVAPAGIQAVKDMEDGNAKAWKLAYLPGLKAVNFVARGVVILAADGKFVWGFDMREQFGFDRNTVHAPGAGAGLFGAVWGDGGEVSVT
ncbi:hypothetical protein Dda_6164 [Drechslerella dactyloides]|uniref:F-box domain-containing protein n=1 Tax=Drechslerella dactyloides TaxID=74499 RepID=A0AAD6IV38_DREDA|nr:hypothetical protein Dda_6164 [Drechslerella dactyloides]